MVTPDWWGYRVRYELTRAFLSGRGIEIGPGISPQKLPDHAEAEYFDKRSSSDLEALMDGTVPVEIRPMTSIRARFPNGADFLIAHQVLEHSANPIRTLTEWHRYVRDNAVVVLSMPDHRFAPGDRNRSDAPLEHLVYDFLLDRHEEDFDSREHIFSFCHGWHYDQLIAEYREFSAHALTSHLLSESRRTEGHDLHWHAIAGHIWKELIEVAAHFDQCSVSFELVADRATTSHFRPDSEILFVYRLSRRETQPPAACIGGIQRQLERALKQIQSSDRRDNL